MGGTPNVPSSVLVQQNNHRGTWSKTYSKTCRNHGPRLNKKNIIKKIKKAEGKEKQCIKGKQTIQMLLKKKFIRSSLETQTLRNSFETQIQI